MKKLPAKFYVTPKVPEKTLHKQIASAMARILPKKVMWWHTPNGEKRDRITAAILKGMGVKAGVPDFLLYDRTTGYLHCLEVKTKDGHLSDAQEGWRTLFMSSPTGRYAVARSLDEALTILQEWWPKDLRVASGMLLPGGGYIPIEDGTPEGPAKP